MSTQSFGTAPEAPRDFAQELIDLVGFSFPFNITTQAGKLYTVDYETEWKSGGTEPVEVIDEKTQEVTTIYQENYEERKLSKSDIKKINQWINDNIEQ